MKTLPSLLIFLALVLSGCDLAGRPVDSPYWAESTAVQTSTYEEILLTSLSYGDYALGGDAIPYYHRYGPENSALTAGGIAYPNGIYISPRSAKEEGYIEYDIREISETFDTFVCKVGKLDVGPGVDRVIISFVVDGKLMSRTPYLSQGKETYLIDVVIPYGAKKLRIECRFEHGVGDGASVIGDGRFLHAQHLDKVTWPGEGGEK